MNLSRRIRLDIGVIRGIRIGMVVIREIGMSAI